MVNIAIVGSREFNDYELLRREITNYICDNFDAFEHNDRLFRRRNTWPGVAIVSGGAKGADTLAEILAEQYNLPKIIFKPDWDLYGKRAGFVRNAKIVDNCDVLFAFQINKSKGTQHSIDLAREKGKEVYVFEVMEDNNG